LLQNRKRPVLAPKVLAPEPGLTLAGQPRKNISGRKMVKIDLERVEKLASQGLNHEQIARNLGTTRETLNKRKKQFIAFSDALEKGRATFIESLSTGYVDLVAQRNVAAIIYGTKVHLGWRENEPLINVHNEQHTHMAPDPAVLEADRNLIREAIQILRAHGVPAAVEFEEAEFRKLPDPNESK
jgi:hypothetical protein